MCYAFTPVSGPAGAITWLPKKVIEQYLQQGLIREAEWIYPGDRSNVFTWIDGEIAATPMRFDLVPRFFLARENLPLADMLKRKQSRKKSGDGFSSYNARSETLLEKASFRTPWAESKRVVVPVSAFRERPNEDDAPPEFRGREYIVHLAAPKNLAGIYDRWTNPQGETLESFGIITVDSTANPLLRSIYHPRCPLILDHAQVEAWLDPETTPARALEMIKLFPADSMSLEEVPRAPKPAAKPGAAEQLGLGI